MAVKTTVTRTQKGALVITFVALFSGSILAEDSPSSASSTKSSINFRAILTEIKESVPSQDYKDPIGLLADSALNFGSLYAVQWTSSKLLNAVQNGLQHIPGAQSVVKSVTNELPDTNATRMAKRLMLTSLAYLKANVDLTASYELQEKVASAPADAVQTWEPRYASLLVGLKHVPVVGDKLPEISPENSGYYAKGIALALGLARGIVERK